MVLQKKIGKSSFKITIFLLLLFYTKVIYSQDEKIRVDTDLVLLPVTVMDWDGRYVTDLQKDDFQIFEDGVEQDISFFETVDKPFTILFLLDTSGSMKNYLPELASAANTFLDQLRPNNQFIAASFCDYTKILQNPANVEEIKKNVKIKLSVCGRETRLYEAVEFSLKYMKKIRGRKAIILFSDGLNSGGLVSDFRSYTTARDNLRDAEENDALIYTIRFGSFPLNPPSYANKEYYYKRIEEIDQYMKDLALKTGGRPFQIEDIANLEETFKMVADELGKQYGLGYYPNPLENGQKKQVRQIKVKVNKPNLAVRARSSYVIEKK